jgi:hypothetical protein
MSSNGYEYPVRRHEGVPTHPQMLLTAIGLTAQYLQCLSFLHSQLRRLLGPTVARHQVAETYQIPLEPPQAIDMFLGPK